MDKELLLTPVVISRNEKEKCLIETSINSVRVSIAIKKSDRMEEVLVDRFTRFLGQRAEDFLILRRQPVKVPTGAHGRVPGLCSLTELRHTGLRPVVPHHQLPLRGHVEAQAR